METTSSSRTHVEQELKYTGVRKRKWGKYVCEIRLPNSRERIWLGSYHTAEKAARAFDAAQFCLRGPNARFNFPDDPPNIAGAQSLTPAEIQEVAQKYAAGRLPEESGGGDGLRPANSIDWSFLDTIDDQQGSVCDFGLFNEPADVYGQPHLADQDHYVDDDVDNGHGHGGYMISNSLWNF